MKRICLILTVLIIGQACSSDDEANTAPDELVVNLSEISKEGLTSFEVGDGNWGLDIDAEFEGDFDVEIETDQSWEIEIETIEGGQDTWIVFDTIAGNGQATVTAKISSNSNEDLRSASIVITTDGGISSSKKITAKQTGQNFLKVDWNEEFLDSEVVEDSTVNSLVFESTAYSETEIGSFETKSDSVKVTSSEEWVNIRIEEGRLILDMEEHDDYEDTRTAILKVEDTEGGLCQDIELKQQPKEQGTLKIEWSDDYLEVDSDKDSVLVFESKSYAETLIGTYETDSDLEDLEIKSSEEWVKAEINEDGVVLNLEKNKNYEETRNASLTITAEGGLKKSIELKQQPQEEGSLEVQWNDKYRVPEIDENALIFSSSEKTEIEIGEYDADTDEIEAKSSESWAHVDVSGEAIKVDLDKNTNQNERTTTITVTNPYGPEGGIDEEIQLIQYISDNIVDKSQWSIKPGNENTSAMDDGPFSNIIDGNPETHWEWDWQWDWDDDKGVESKFPDVPYEFIIDLSEEQVFNTIKLWQTQTAENGYVRDVQFMVSNDGSDWKDLGVYRMAENQGDAEENYQDPYVYELPATYNARYFKLVILSNVSEAEGDNKVNVGENAYMGELDVSFE